MKLVKACLLSIGTLATACGGGGGNSGDECAANLVAGDLVITEVMANPDGADEGNEYWEFFNPGSSPVDLTGLVLFSAKPDGSDEDGHVMRAATIMPGQYFVVGQVLDEFKPGHVDYGYANDLGALRNAGGKLGLRCKGILVDEIEYGEADDGVALELDGSQAPDAVFNDTVANFCNATNEFLPDNFGTPQESNGFCSIVAPGVCNDNGTDRDTVPPALGDVVITEIMPNPAGNEGQDMEWVEVLALADFDLNGLNLGVEPGTPRAQIDSPDCIPATAGDHFIFAQSLDETVNGGLPQPDGIFSFDFKAGTTSTGDGQAVIGIGTEPLDVITWTDSDDGISLNLNPAANDPVENDLLANFCAGREAYGDAGNFGTPRAANSICVLAGQCIDAGDGLPRSIVTPGMGEIAISEWMANPEAAAGGDNTGEYVEVQFSVAADANGLQLGSTAGTVTSTVDSQDCVPVAADGFVVFVRDLDPLQNGGIDIGVAETGFGMVNGGDRLFVGFGDVEFDVIATTGNATTVGGNDGGPGVSEQIDPGDGVTRCDTPAGNTYGDGDTGTPGAANATCP